MRAICARGRDADFGPLEAVRYRGGSEIASMRFCLVPVGPLVAEPIDEPVDLVIERGQCCCQLAGVKQGVEHQPIGKGEQRARLQFGVNPPGEDPPLPPDDDDLVCGEGHLAHEVARDKDGPAFAGAVGRQPFPVPNRPAAKRPDRTNTCSEPVRFIPGPVHPRPIFSCRLNRRRPRHV